MYDVQSKLDALASVGWTMVVAILIIGAICQAIYIGYNILLAKKKAAMTEEEFQRHVLRDYLDNLVHYEVLSPGGADNIYRTKVARQEAEMAATQ